MRAAEAEATPLVERAAQLGALEARLAEVAARSRGAVVLVGGEAGIGKTALLRAFAARVRPPARLLWAACDPLFTPRPLGPLLDIAPALGGEVRERIERGARPHDVAAALGRELAARAPTVLVVEDLQWADEATLDVVRLLARRADGLPALLVASFRDELVHGTHPLGIVLGELPGAGRLALEPLSRAAVAELARASPLDAAELYERTGGNPFFVTEALAAETERVPATVRDAVLARAARLSPPARALLDAVAVVPQTTELWLLEALAGSLAALDEGLASGMLAGDAHGVAFRHELARLAVAGSLAPHRAVALHRAAAAALSSPAARPADPARLAHHAEAAADPEGVLRWAPEAASRAAASGAHREAAAQYARALRFADRLPLERRAELLERRAEECDLTAEYDAAIAAQRGALDCRRRLGDPRGAADALRSLSRMLFFNGRGAEGQPLAVEAVELLERLPPGRELALAYGNLCQREMVLEHTASALAWGGRALALAERLGDAEATVYSLVNLGAAQGQAESDEAEVTLRRALALSAGRDEHAARAYLHLTHAALRRGKLDAAGEHLDAGLRFCADRGLDAWRLYLLALAARRELARARWDEAAAAATAVLRDPRNAPVPRGWALTAVGLVRARRGDPGATQALDEAHALVHATGEPMRVVPAAAARAEAAWLRGEDERVEEATEAALALARDRGARRLAAELACWRRRAGIADDLGAEDVAGPHALDPAAASQSWRRLGHPYEAALALADTGDPDALRQALDELLALGARPAATLVSRRLRALGARDIPRGPRRRTRENPAGLTPREVEVLRLLADGLRNAEIAARLIVSPKTVDHHVSRILHKLDVPTRSAAGAAAARLGLTDAT